MKRLTLFLLVCFSLTACLTASAKNRDKTVKKHAKEIIKQGWKPEPGMPAIEEQIKQVLKDKFEEPYKYFLSSVFVEGKTLSEAMFYARLMAISEIGEQRLTKVEVRNNANSVKENTVEEKVYESNDITNDTENIEFAQLFDVQAKVLIESEYGESKDDFKISFESNWLVNGKSKYVSKHFSHESSTKLLSKDFFGDKILSLYRIKKDGTVEVQLTIKEPIDNENSISTMGIQD